MSTSSSITLKTKDDRDVIDISKKFSRPKLMEYFQDKSHSFRKRFVKDFNLPIQILQSPYFEYSLETLNKQFNVEEKVEMLKKVTNDLKSEDEFFVYTNTLIDKVLKDLSTIEEYENFQKYDMSNFETVCRVQSEVLYQKKNINRSFFSIDLVKANFQALHFVNVIKEKNFEEFISKYTEYDYFKEAKYFRQVVFGKLNPKRQQKVQKYLVSLIVEKLLLSKFDGIEIFSFTSDEIILSSDGLEKSEILKVIESLEISIHFDEFTLRDLESKKGELFYIKELPNKLEFKKVPAHFFLQAYKKWHNEEIIEYDRKFYYEGYISTFDEPIF